MGRPSPASPPGEPEAAAPLSTPLAGETCETVRRGGVFRCDDVAEVTPRVGRGEVVVTGQLPSGARGLSQFHFDT